MGDATMSFGAGHSSQEEMDDEPPPIEDSGWDRRQSYQRGESASSSGKEGTASSTQTSKLPLPMQKRRRVTRACDECRRKKIKCDGKQPCTHCTVYSYGERLQRA